MSIEIKAPSFPESVSEGEIAAWNAAVGDAVSAGDVLVEIETDKVVLEVQATEDGVLESITKNEGDTVTSEEVIGSIKAGAVVVSDKSLDKPEDAPAKAEAPAASADPAEANQDETPAVRRLLAENNLDASQISGSGKGGKLTLEDVKLYLDSRLRGNDTKAAQPTAPVAKGARTEERVKMNRLRKTVAKRLLDVQHGAALLTTFNEVDMYEVMQLRKQYKDVFEKKHGTRLGFMSFFTKACVAALQKFPAVNASIDGEEIVYHGYFDVGIAVGSERGLVVPVVRDADQKSMADIEKEIRDFGVRARDGKIGIEEMQGGTFTITNGGTFGSMLSTPIINAPQSGILGMHNIVERPHVVNGEIKIRPIMYLALTYDHRIIDGRESVQFLYTIKELLENPARLLLDV